MNVFDLSQVIELFLWDLEIEVEGREGRRRRKKRERGQKREGRTSM